MIVETATWVSLVPLLVVVVLAVTTKKVLEPLIVGTLVGAMMMGGWGFVTSWTNLIISTMTDETVAWILVVVALLGVLISLADAAKGLAGLSDAIQKFVKTANGSLFATFVLGVIIFIDEYMNAILVGGSMKRLTDRFKVPREVLAYVTNTTGTPIAVLVPITGWAAFIIGLFSLNGVASESGAFMAYVKTIPFILYAIISVVLVLLFTRGLVPHTRYVKKAFARAETGSAFPPGAEPATTTVEVDEKDGPEPRIGNFLWPIIAMVAGTIAFDMDLAAGLITGVAVSLVLFLLNRTMTYNEFFENFIDGLQQMVFLLVFIVMLFVLVGVNDELGAVEYVFRVSEPYLTGPLLPVITLLIVAALSFTTGSFFGTMAIALPLIMSFIDHTGAHMYMTLGAMVSGAVFGSHVCLFGDAVTLTSTSTEVRNADQLRVSLPYATVTLGISAVLYLVMGYML